MNRCAARCEPCRTVREGEQRVTQQENAAGAEGLGPLRPPSTGERIAERLATAIAAGEFSVGDRLPSERELAARLEVSRESVRAALKRMAEDGLVEVRRGRGGGAFVCADWVDASAAAVRRTLLPDWAAFESLFDFRRLVEGLVARTAAERADATDRAHLTELLARFEATSTPAEARRADTELHLAVARATHNDRLVELHRRLLAEVSLGVSAEPYTDEVLEAARPHHRELVAAVLAGDAERAGTIARHHFAITEDELRRLAARAQQGATSGE